MAPTLAQIAKLNAGVGHIERAQEQVRRGDLPLPPHGDDGIELGLARVALLGMQLRADPRRRQARIEVETIDDASDYALDVGNSTAIATSMSPASETGILNRLLDEVRSLSEPVLAEGVDEDNDGNLEALHLAAHWHRITFTAAQSEDYTVDTRWGSRTVTSSGSLTGADLLDDIVQKLVDELEQLASANDDVFDVRGIDSDSDGLLDVLYLTPRSPRTVHLSVSATGSGGATIDATGDASDITYAWNSSSSTNNAELDVARDATQATFEVWGRSQAFGEWQRINGLSGLQVSDNWTENLESLADFDRGFVRVTSTDGRLVPKWAPALG
jgi:hypothetical protein